MRPDNLYFIPNRSTQPANLMPYVALHPKHPDLSVSFGQTTFNAEGQESRGKLFSRVIHWPGGASGVTIGRGYDMGQRTRLQILSELQHAGMSEDAATFLSGAAGLRGESARRFVAEKGIESPILSLPSQRALFETITTPEILADVKRILAKPDLQATYGSVTWEQLQPEVQELVFDLRYRGDYTPETRKRIQPALVSGDREMLTNVIQDRGYWTSRGVSSQRIEERIALLAGRDSLRQVG